MGAIRSSETSVNRCYAVLQYISEGTVLTGRGERNTTQQAGPLSVGKTALHTPTRKYHRDFEMLS
jgi:hypothetical protein